MNTENNEQAGGPQRSEAAALLAAVSRDDAASGAIRLHCLAALDVLDVPEPWKRHTIGDGDSQGRITRALHLLGGLPLAQFSRPEVLTAARHARRALRELR